MGQIPVWERARVWRVYRPIGFTGTKEIDMRRSQLIPLLKKRSLLFSLLTVVPAAIVILGLAACVKHPVGDPEKSKVDPQYAGVWLTEDADGSGSFLVMLPYDSRTYFAKIMSYRKTVDGVEPTEIMDCKAWLTSIGGATFITMEPLSWGKLAKVRDKPPYLVGKIALVDSALQIRLLDGGKPLVRDADNSRELEAAIAEHVDSDSLFVDETTVFKQVGDKTRIETALKAFHQQI